MAREPMIPLSAVESLINSTRDFNRSLVELLGAHLERAAEHYERALNPPVPEGPSTEMVHSRMGDIEEDYLHQVESGLISVNDVPPNIRRLFADTDLMVEPN